MEHNCSARSGWEISVGNGTSLKKIRVPFLENNLWYQAISAEFCLPLACVAGVKRGRGRGRGRGNLGTRERAREKGKESSSLLPRARSCALNSLSFRTPATRPSLPFSRSQQSEFVTLNKIGSLSIVVVAFFLSPIPSPFSLPFRRLPLRLQCVFFPKHTAATTNTHANKFKFDCIQLPHQS